MTTVNPFFASKAAEANISALFGTTKTEAASAIAAIVAGSPTVSAVPPTAGNAAAGKITAALIPTAAAKTSNQVSVQSRIESASNPRELAAAIAGALVVQDIPDFFDRPLEPVTFSSGESAIAMGWSYIGELASNVSAVNTAMRSLNGDTVEIARALFGDEAAERVQKLNEGHVEATNYMLKYRMDSINRAFNVSGNLVQTDDNGTLSMGRFTLSYDNGNFRANVGTDQHAWVVQNGAVREVSVHQVSADLVAGKLML